MSATPPSSGSTADTARGLAFDAELAEFFESAVAADADAEPPVIANWVTGELVAATPRGRRRASDRDEGDPRGRGRRRRDGRHQGDQPRLGRELLTELVTSGGDPAEISERLGLAGGDGDDLAGIVASAIEEQPDAAAKVKAGEGKAIGAIVGVVMRETKGRADGGEVTRLIREQLGL